MQDLTNTNIGIKTYKVREQQGGKIWYRFIITVEDGKPIIILIANNESILTIWRELRMYCDKLSPVIADGRKQIEAVVAAAPVQMLIGVKFQGWHGGVFITEDWKRGTGLNNYCFIMAMQRKPRRQGSRKRYKRTVVKPSMKSRYLSFAIMLGLAGPLLKFAELSEGVVFHFYGSSTTGKTSCAHVGESISRCPDALLGWGQTERRMEELAADRNDQLLTLNAAEKAGKRHQGTILHLLTHQISEGDAMGRSRSVHETLPNLTSRSPILSTGNLSGVEMARSCAVDWHRQEEARFISIPVPPAAVGGIIDRSGKTRGGEENRELIEKIVAASCEDYGVVLPAWVMKVYHRRDEISGLIDEFVSRSAISDAYKVRVARKFGLVYAAGAIAASTNFMPWTPKFVFDVVHGLMMRTLTSVADELTPEKVVRVLKAATLGKGKLPRLPLNRRLRLDGRPLVGFRYRKEGQVLIALRREALPALTGLPASSETLIDMLGNAGVIEKGHGGKMTQQVPFKLETSQGTESKSLRMLIFDASKLSRRLEA